LVAESAVWGIISVPAISDTPYSASFTMLRRGPGEPVRISPQEARSYLVGQLGLAGVALPGGADGVRALLLRLRCIQLDPLDVIGTNADLVALARVDGISRGDIFRHLFPGHAFEHFAKERCLLPAEAFPWYRDRAAETPWWRLSERLTRLPPSLLDAVLKEVRASGPVTAASITDHGRVDPLSWNGWKGTSRATSMALEVLWTRCQVVVCGRSNGAKLYDVPDRALPHVARRPSGPFDRWALLDRIEAAGLLGRSAASTWSALAAVRTSPLPDALIAEGLVEAVTVGDSARRYLAPAGFRQRSFPVADGRIRILGPLDPLLWDRELVRQAFHFDYVWEVYKPVEERRWGWYVCPLLQGHHLIGRIEAVVDGPTLRVRTVWREPGATIDADALGAALERHATACGARRVIRPRRVRES
jgi:uncharacterized protein YcaQ